VHGKLLLLIYRFVQQVQAVIRLKFLLLVEPVSSLMMGITIVGNAQEVTVVQQVELHLLVLQGNIQHMEAALVIHVQLESSVQLMLLLK